MSKIEMQLSVPNHSHSMKKHFRNYVKDNPKAHQLICTYYCNVSILTMNEQFMNWEHRQNFKPGTKTRKLCELLPIGWLTSLANPVNVKITHVSGRSDTCRSVILFTRLRDAKGG